MINRFGRELYSTFFKDYTRKVWGVYPAQMKAEWGAQRIKGLSVAKVMAHALRRVFNKNDASVAQKSTEQSLIERFLFPKHGPGQLWEEVAQKIKAKGGQIHLNRRVTGLKCSDGKIIEALIENSLNGEKETLKADYFLSTMPVKDLIHAMGEAADKNVKELADGLVYRDFITVGLLLKKLRIKNKTSLKTVGNIVPDLWIYIQEKDVKIGRLQIFNNWSPYMVKDHLNTVWVGLEYFCSEGDELWKMNDDEFIGFAVKELAKIGVIEHGDVLDSCLARIPKAYPSYAGTYSRFAELRRFIDRFDNLFLIGRNGTHRYNNTDHSMLTAIAAAENITEGRMTKDNIWSVNTEEEYHEET
jgi:protoporphyrinogen oxidase